MPNDQSKRLRWAVWIAAALVLLPVLYFLSTGPVARFSDPFNDAANTYLVPLDWAMEHGPDWFQKLTFWYHWYCWQIQVYVVP